MTVYEQSLGMALLLLVGYLGGRLARLLKMPMVAGYVIAGLIMGPSVLHIIPNQLNTEFNLVKVLGLGIIALMIGSELEIKKIRHLGKAIMGITVVQILGASIVVFIAMYFILGLELPISLLLGAMATATAPASPVAVIREYKAKGPFTTTLLGVVAMDDAVCIVLFGIVAALVRMMLDGVFEAGVRLLTIPAVELLGSLVIGTVTGIALVLVIRRLPEKLHKLVVFVGIALLNSGLSNIYHFSPLLTNMMAGFVYANLSDKPQDITVINEVDLPIFVVFFTLAGVSINLSILLQNWIAAAVYIVARGVGKVGGAFLGARISGAPEVVQKYLGFAMFSKAGVTIGLVLLVQGRFPEIAAVITAIELAAVTVCELIGPMGTRYALISSGETEYKPKAKSAAASG